MEQMFIVENVGQDQLEARLQGTVIQRRHSPWMIERWNWKVPFLWFNV